MRQRQEPREAFSAALESHFFFVLLLFYFSLFVSAGSGRMEIYYTDSDENGWKR